MEINKLTSFPVLPAFMMDSSGSENLIVIVKATWRMTPEGELVRHEEQMPIVTAPVYRGEPDSSSLIYESDVVPIKAGTDCILIGHAYAPQKDTCELEAVFSVGPLVRVVQVYGERKWGKILGVRRPIGPIPFEKMPLIYERSFGGTDESHPDSARHEVCHDNPVGRGFLAKHSKKNIDDILFPNIEDPNDLYKGIESRPKPAGFGAVAPFWKPRVDYAGTYDEKWLKHNSPLPPAAIRPEYFNYAPPGLTSKGFLRGNEWVALGNVAPHQRIFRFSLPDVRPQVVVKMLQDRVELESYLDAIIVEPDDMRVQMVWRAGYNVHGKIRQIRQIQIET